MKNNGRRSLGIDNARVSAISAHDHEDLSSVCRATAAAAAVHRAGGFEAAQQHAPNEAPAGFLAVLGALTEACVCGGGAAEEAEGSWLGQATELLLDAWVELCMDDPGGYFFPFLLS